MVGRHVTHCKHKRQYYLQWRPRTSPRSALQPIDANPRIRFKNEFFVIKAIFLARDTAPL